MTTYRIVLTANIDTRDKHTAALLLYEALDVNCHFSDVDVIRMEKTPFQVIREYVNIGVMYQKIHESCEYWRGHTCEHKGKCDTCTLGAHEIEKHILEYLQDSDTPDINNPNTYDDGKGAHNDK